MLVGNDIIIRLCLVSFHKNELLVIFIKDRKMAQFLTEYYVVKCYFVMDIPIISI